MSPGRQSPPAIDRGASGVIAATDHTLQAGTDDNLDVSAPLYRSSTVKRIRSTNNTLDRIDDEILTALTEEHPATLRGTYYRVVSRGAVEKTEGGYRLVGRQVLKLRRSGRLPYSWITDGTRYVIRPDTWTDLDQMLSTAASSYRRMLWEDQQVDVHIFTEKDAITGVIEGVCDEWHVPLGVLRGYASESFCWKVAESLPTSHETYLYQLGDHDPSGVDAWRNFEDKVRGFAPDAPVTFERIAVTPEQIDAWSLPTRPTKKSDTRAGGFKGGSVEVDAIRPVMLRELVRDAIERHIDVEQLRLTRAVEASERVVLRSLIVGAR